jgi:hypothetical protein
VSFEYDFNIGVAVEIVDRPGKPKRYKRVLEDLHSSGGWDTPREFLKPLGVKRFFFMECFFLAAKRNIPGVRGSALHKKSRPQASRG